MTTPLRAAIGPGLLMAGAAVGVSHLVQATRAGADYGLALLGLVLAACILKYPFLEFGPRYAAATGESMIAGFRRMGRLPLAAFTFITVSTMFIVLASLTVVTAGLTGLVFGLDLPVTALSALVLGGSLALQAIGRYAGLDLAMKIIMTGLAVSTVTAVALALGSGIETPVIPLAADLERLWSAAGLAFVLALLGWMPIPLDVAAWHSIWTLERAQQTGQPPSVAHAVLDFRLGYAGATLLAAAFLVLGAMVMYGTGNTFPPTAVGFSGALVDLYGATLGDWSRPVIAVAALTAMFSTTLAVSDAFPRVIREILLQALPDHRDPVRRLAVPATAIILTVGALVIIGGFGHRFTGLVDFTTTVSFLAAPVLGWLNLKLIHSDFVPAAYRPGPALMALAWAGLVFLTGFSLVWAGWRLAG